MTVVKTETPDDIMLQDVLEAYQQTQGSHPVTWADLVAAARPLYEAYLRDELGIRQIAERLGLDLVSTDFVLEQMYGPEWVKIHYVD